MGRSEDGEDRRCAIGRVGVPFFNNLTLSGGPAPVRAYIGELLPDVLEGKIEPGRVFDRLVGPEGYRAMDQREAIKVMINP